MEHGDTDSIYYDRYIDEEIQILGLVKLWVTGLQLPDCQAFMCAEKLTFAVISNLGNVYSAAAHHLTLNFAYIADVSHPHR